MAVAGIVYGDLWLRARAAYREGEKYLEWDSRPEVKRASLDADLARAQQGLLQAYEAGRLTRRECEERLALARFGREEASRESSLKYAVVWFQTAAELFSPPQTRWSARARQRLPAAKELWKKELAAKRVPYQDYMLD